MPEVTTPPSLLQYALVITRIGLTSFGGGLSGWMLRVIVHDRRWISEAEFLSGLALCQVFPGINVLNLAIWLGFRLHGSAGAIAGAAAMLVPPGLVLLAIGWGFAGLSDVHAVRAALAGVAAAAIGLTGAMGLRAARQAATRPVPALVMLGTFGAVGLLRLPLVPVLLAVVPLSVGYAFLQERSHAA